MVVQQARGMPKPVSLVVVYFIFYPKFHIIFMLKVKLKKNIYVK